MFPDILLANVFGGMPAFLRGVVRATPIQNNIIGREEPEKPRMTVANKVALYAEVPAASIWAVLKGLGFDVEVNYPEPIVSLAQEMFGYLLKLSPDLNSFPIKRRKVLEIKADIVEKLKKFFVENLLEEVETPHAAL